jgi:DNA invertase Pin-like site-specific DNA recombinase
MITPSDKPKTKCVLYARFSPRPNAAECESCESQLHELKQYAWKRGYEIVGEFSDKALSGGEDWADRPGMWDAMRVCKRGMIFIVRAFDRLFRDTEKALVFRSMLLQKGIKIRSITEESACDGSPVANLVQTIFLAIAEYQRAITRARTSVAMLRHQADGRRMSALPPWGTTRDPVNPARLVKDVNECAAIDTMKHLHNKGYSFRAIARWLDENNIPRRSAKKWSHVQVARCLRREGVC